MVLKRIEQSDVIDIKTITMLIYAPPGMRKTSLAQTSSNPYTLDFDLGIHRSFNRKRADQLEQWDDIFDPRVDQAIKECGTVVMDTIGRTVDYISQKVSTGRAPTIQQWGTIKMDFLSFHNKLRSSGKDIVFLAHQKDASKEDATNGPDCAGGAKDEVKRVSELIGYVYMESGQHILSFEPTDRYIGKNGAAFPAKIVIPPFETSPNFLAELIAKAKLQIGKTAEASAAIARQVDEWRGKLAAMAHPEDPASYDALMHTIPSDIQKPVKMQVWGLFQEQTRKHGIAWDQATKKHVSKGASNKPPAAETMGEFVF